MTFAGSGTASAAAVVGARFGGLPSAAGAGAVRIAKRGVPLPLGDLGMASVAPDSWSSVVRGPASSSMDLSYVPPPAPSSGGRIRLQPPQSVVAQGVSRWQFTLVGFFLDRLPFSFVQKVALKVWGSQDLLEVLSNGDGFFFFRFSSEVGMQAVLGGGAWHFGGRPIFLRKWRPGLNLSKVGCRRVPIWVHFSHIPLEYWTADGLSIIASVVGKPLFADALTDSLQRLSFARICVEVDVDSEFPRSVDLDLGDGEVVAIAIDYRWLPKRCLRCREFGHSTGLCKKPQVWLPRGSSTAMAPLVGAAAGDSGRGKEVARSPPSSPDGAALGPSVLAGCSREVLSLGSGMVAPVGLEQGYGSGLAEARASTVVEAHSAGVAAGCSSGDHGHGSATERTPPHEGGLAGRACDAAAGVVLSPGVGLALSPSLGMACDVDAEAIGPPLAGSSSLAPALHYRIGVVDGEPSLVTGRCSAGGGGPFPDGLASPLSDSSMVPLTASLPLVDEVIPLSKTAKRNLQRKESRKKKQGLVSSPSSSSSS